MPPTQMTAARIWSAMRSGHGGKLAHRAPRPRRFFVATFSALTLTGVAAVVRLALLLFLFVGGLGADASAAAARGFARPASAPCEAWVPLLLASSLSAARSAPSALVSLRACFGCGLRFAFGRLRLGLCLAFSASGFGFRLRLGRRLGFDLRSGSGFGLLFRPALGFGFASAQAQPCARRQPWLLLRPGLGFCSLLAPGLGSASSSRARAPAGRSVPWDCPGGFGRRGGL